MTKRNVLAQLDIGASVAESDQNLAAYFVQTTFMDDLVADRFDLVRGTKGSGKSALLRILAEKQSEYEALGDVTIVSATNHTGDPVFREVFTEFEEDAVKADERDLIDAWKLYWLNLILQSMPPELNDAPGVSDLTKEVEKHAIKSDKKGLWETLRWSLVRILHPTRLKAAAATLDGTGGSVEAEYQPHARTEGSSRPIPFGKLFSSLDEILKSKGVRAWLLLDRLDEAFPGKPELEARALRSLLYAFKDTLGLESIRVKIFLRDDIYGQVTQEEGFTALTHIGDRASSPIQWDEEALLALLVERLLWSESLRDFVGFSGDADSRKKREKVFYSIFPDKVDASDNKPTTVNWIMRRLRDGNGVVTPRDLIELVKHARTVQLDVYDRDRVDEETPELVTGPTLKTALARLSKDKIKNTLFAEAPHLRGPIESFKDSKAEHTEETLAGLLGEDCQGKVSELVAVGFLERLSKSYKIPFLYRDGAGVTQGKAF